MWVIVDNELTDKEKIELFLISKGIPEKTFSDVAGLNELKQTIGRIMNFCKQLLNGNINFEYPGKILIFGPPGTGKTLMANAIAGELGWELYELRLSTIISEYLGLTQKNMALIFDEIKKRGKKKKEQTGKGIVFFIDEFDYLAKDRGDKGELGDMKRLVNVILKEFDELLFSEYSVLTICATNHQKLLDSAVWRRFNLVRKIDYPDENDRDQIIRFYLKQFKEIGIELIDQDKIIADLIELTEKSSGSEIKRDLNEIIVSSISEGKMQLDKDKFIYYYKKYKSEILQNIFFLDDTPSFNSPLTFNIPSEVNPVFYRDLLMKYIDSEKNYQNLIQTAMIYDNLDESIKKMLLTINFSIFYQNNVKDYLIQLKKSVDNLRGRK